MSRLSVAFACFAVPLSLTACRSEQTSPPNAPATVQAPAAPPASAPAKAAPARGALPATGPARVAPIALPGGPPGIGFDDLRFSAALGGVLVPAGRSGNVDLIDPAS